MEEKRGPYKHEKYQSVQAIGDRGIEHEIFMHASMKITHST
jgi:hypothetical protein